MKTMDDYHELYLKWRFIIADVKYLEIVKNLEMVA